MSLLRNSIFIIIAVAMTLVSCNRQMIYSHYESVNTEGWDRSDSKEFSVSIQEKGSYAESFGLRTTRDYPYTNLAIIVTQEVKPSGVQRADTLNIDITDSEGNNVVEGLNYRQRDVQFPAIRLEAGDSVFVNIRHYMRREVLPGIANVGFSMEKTD